MIAVAAGHRSKTKGNPSALEFDFAGKDSDILFDRLLSLAITWLNAHPQVDKILTDLSPGWNLVVGQAALQLGIEFEVYIPHEDHTKKIFKPWRKKYFALLAAATKVHQPNFGVGGPYTDTVRDRNLQRMTARANLILALYNGVPNKHEDAYRLLQLNDNRRTTKKHVCNLWNNWVKYRTPPQWKKPLEF